MLKWFKKKAAATSGLNIKLNTKTLVSIANRVDERIEATGGGQDNKDEVKKVTKAQKELLKDVVLGTANGLTKDQIETIVHEAMDGLEVTKGAQMAVDHVLKHAEES